VSGEVSAEDREKAVSLIVAALPESAWTVEGALALGVDALVAAGWRPGGAPARPPREAMIGVAFEAWKGPDACSTIVDALLAADHLWADGPTTGPEKRLRKAMRDAMTSLATENVGAAHSILYRALREPPVLDMRAARSHEDDAAHQRTRDVIQWLNDNGFEQAAVGVDLEFAIRDGITK